MHRRISLSALSLALILGACSQPGSEPPRPQDRLSVTLNLPQLRALGAQGLPYAPGGAGVQEVKVSVLDGQGQPVRFNGDNAADPQGQQSYFVLTPGKSQLNLSVVAGVAYTFTSRAYDLGVTNAGRHLLAFGKVSQSFTASGQTLALLLKSVLGGGRLTSLPLNMVVPGQEVEYVLGLSANGRDDLRVPQDDFQVAYTVQNGANLGTAEPKRGVLVRADSQPTGDLLVTATVTGLLAAGQDDAVEGQMTVTARAPFAVNVGVGSDLVAPTIQSFELLGRSGEQVTLCGAVQDNLGVVSARIYSGARLLRQLSAGDFTGTTFTATVPGVRPGEQTLTLLVKDAAGNEMTADLKVPAGDTADTIAPTVSALSATPNPLRAAGDVTLRAQASDNVGVTAVSFYDGARLLGTDSTAPYEWTQAYTAAENGTRTLKAVATDAAGNRGETTTTLTVDIPAAPGPFLGSGPATLSADVVRSNRGEGVGGSTVRIYRSGDRQTVLAERTTSAAGYVEFAAIPEGTYDLVFSKAGMAGSEINGAAARGTLNTRLKVGQFSAADPNAPTDVPQLKLLTPDGAAWKTLAPGAVFNDAVNLRAYTTGGARLMRYFMFSLVTVDASGQMADLRGGLTSLDPGVTAPGEGQQDSGLVSLPAAGLLGDIYVQVSALDFNYNRVAYLVPVTLRRSGTPGAVTAPTGVAAVAYTLSERIGYIMGVGPQGAPQGSNLWVSVSWSQPASTEGLTGFRVLRAAAAGGPYTQVAFADTAQCSSATKRCTVSDNTSTLEADRDYFYRVTAVGAAEATSDAPALPSTHTLLPFRPQLVSPAKDSLGADLLPTYTLRTNAFATGATGARFTLRTDDVFTGAGRLTMPSVVLQKTTSTTVTDASSGRVYFDSAGAAAGNVVNYDAATDLLSLPHSLDRVALKLTPAPLQANRRYSWYVHMGYAYRLQDPAQPQSATNPIVAYAVYSDPDTTKVVPGGVTQSYTDVYDFITRP
ncbi:hypothetical protein K7W42_02045 [Deinococcus sp. HMF7604]|uniref:Ig-like domain-containing protein n=1 Tax=Deinococcus betulae TaxID=2873312 RepID=UPI001CCEA9AC|nr:Ig-like domain-containing protein [Deinococcus betulae]MBZ9749638.1 hypothetical protein [Deinococcus betulae]